MNIIEPLLNRMSTDDINRMKDYRQQYPHSGDYLFDSLKKTGNWLSLEYDVVCLLNDVFGRGYNPTAISDLFDNK